MKMYDVSVQLSFDDIVLISTALSEYRGRILKTIDSWDQLNFDTGNLYSEYNRCSQLFDFFIDPKNRSEIYE